MLSLSKISTASSGLFNEAVEILRQAQRDALIPRLILCRHLVTVIGTLVTTGRKIKLSHKSLFVSVFCKRTEKRSYF